MRRALFDVLVPRFAALGFRWEAGRDRFVREHAETTDLFPLICTDAKPGWWVQQVVAIRIEMVEQIFHQTSGFGGQDQTGTATLGASVGTILGGKNLDGRLLLEREDQVEPVATEIMATFSNVALPYYARWSSLRAIDAELNDDPTVRSPHRGGPPLWRCSTGIIVAKLVGRSDYDALAAYYTDVMTRVSNGFYLKQYLALLESLRSVEPASGLSRVP